jgi:hypothetical protein
MVASGRNAGARRNIDPATQAALWTLSNGTCYAPGCPIPVVLEVRPGVYKKNVQVAHIYGVRGQAARHRKDIDSNERDSFARLILLCLAHHSAVDDKETGEMNYPPELLIEWKKRREGKDHAVLNTVAVPAGDPEVLTRYLETVFEPPLKRLETLAESLQTTGELTENNLTELNRIIQAMLDSPVGVDQRTASTLMEAADMLSHLKLASTASKLMEAADMMAHLPRQPPGGEW